VGDYFELTDSSRLRIPPVYGEPSPAQQARVERLLADAGFTPMTILRRAGGAEVSVVIGQKGAVSLHMDNCGVA
ncbi:MAG: hypothetical protein ACK4SA_10875, partial [Caldilinea sp.]